MPQPDVAAALRGRAGNSSLIRFTEINQDGKRTKREQFTFRLNPSKVTVESKKINSYQLTKAGYDRQFWQNDLFVVSFSGSTGAFVPDPSQPVIRTVSGTRPIFDLRSTKAWGDFSRFFSQFYLEVGPENIRMEFFGFDFNMIGSLDTFKWDLDSDKNPGHIIYSFVFTGFPRRYTLMATEMDDINQKANETQADLEKAAGWVSSSKANIYEPGGAPRTVVPSVILPDSATPQRPDQLQSWREFEGG